MIFQKSILYVLFATYEIYSFCSVYYCDTYLKAALIIIFNLLVCYQLFNEHFDYIDRFYIKFKVNRKSLIQYNIVTSIVSIMIFSIYFFIVNLILYV